MLVFKKGVNKRKKQYFRNENNAVDFSWNTHMQGPHPHKWFSESTVGKGAVGEVIQTSEYLESFPGDSKWAPS